MNIGKSKSIVLEVVIVTYNAEKYIQQAIESVVSQKTDFPFEVHIYDDCSKDNTCNIVSTFVKKHDIVYLHTSEINQGTFANLQRSILNCKSEFIALLEGDDYWNHQNKLQQQVDFLKANPQHVGCASNSLVYDQSMESFTSLYNPKLKEQYSLPELFSIPPFQIGTLVFRKKCIPTLPDDFKNTISNDKILYTLLALHGIIYCFNENFSVYRKHNESISNSPNTNEILEKQYLLYNVMKNHFPVKYFRNIDEALYTHIKGHFITNKNKKQPILINFLKFIKLWFKLKKFTSLYGYRELYYFSRKIIIV